MEGTLPLPTPPSVHRDSRLVCAPAPVAGPAAFVVAAAAGVGIVTVVAHSGDTVDDDWAAAAG